MRARAVVVVVLLMSYGAVGARQPAVRMAVALPIPAERIANALDIFVDRSQPLRARRRARAVHRRAWSRATRGCARTCGPHSSPRLRRRAKPFRCLSTRPSGVRRCSSGSFQTTRSSAPSSPIAAPRSSITGSPASTTRRWRGSDPNARRCVTCSVTPVRSASSGRACAYRPDASSCLAARTPNRSGRPS